MSSDPADSKMDITNGDAVLAVDQATPWNPFTAVQWADIKGDSPEEKIANFAASYPVALIVKSTCPFCIEAKALLTRIYQKAAAGRTPQDDRPVMAYLEVDAPGQPTQEIKDAMAAKSGVKTVPNIYVGGEFIGGCNDMKSLDQKGDLLGKLAKANALNFTRDPPGVINNDNVDPLLALISQDKQRDNHIHDDAHHEPYYGPSKPTIYNQDLFRHMEKHGHRAGGALFLFPETVDNHVIRVTGCLTAIFCVFAIIFRNYTQIHWATACLAIDFGIRIVKGGAASPIGTIASVLCSRLKPKISPGPPKQFAACCGLTFAVLGTILFFTDNPIPAAVIMGLLMCATGMEGFFNFCAGCLMFGWLIKFGILSDDIYSSFLETKDEATNAWDEEMPGLAQRGLTCEDPQIKVVSAAAEPLDIDLRYKTPKPDEWIRMNFHFIRNCQVTYFNAIMSVAGLAVVWKVMAQPNTFQIAKPVYYALGIGAALAFVILLLLFILKLALYTRKVYKEWQCPIRSNAFPTISISIMLFAYLVYDVDENNTGVHTFGRVLFWIGAITNMIIAIVKGAEWVALRSYTDEFINAGWMIAPVGNLVAALVGPAIDPTYTEAAYFWYGPSILMWLALFAVTLRKAIIDHASEPRTRPFLWVWIAAPAVAASASLSLKAGALGIQSPGFEMWERNLLFISVFFALVLGLGFIYPYPYFGKNKFDMSFWGYGFPLDTVAIITTQYWAMVYEGRGGFPKALAIIAIGVATATTFVLLMHTLSSLFRQRLFRSDDKWGPLSLMKLTHEALREFLPKMMKNLETLTSDASNDVIVKEFVHQFYMFEILHQEHSTHEDLVIFKEFNNWFPAAALKFNHDHHADHKTLRDLNVKVRQLESSVDSEDRAGIVHSINETLAPFIDHMKQHLIGEENNLNPIGRKHLPLDMHKILVQRIWDVTSVESWREIIPWTVNNLPYHTQRVRFLKTWMWAMPYRCQQIGDMVYRKVDDVKWTQLVEDVPEMIPRWAPGWRRIF